jgi:hypothetical protein
MPFRRGLLFNSNLLSTLDIPDNLARFTCLVFIKNPREKKDDVLSFISHDNHV